MASPTTGVDAAVAQFLQISNAAGVATHQATAYNDRFILGARP